MSFEIKLPLFQGPFDLLLFFIERDELDIYDIPISKITDEFFQYILHLEKLNMDVASEFILVASTLMSIKAKMLLPRPETDDEGNEIDPRDELVKHLLEYKKYKAILGSFQQLEVLSMQKEKRGNIEPELHALAQAIQAETELQDVSLYKMLKVYIKAMQRYATEQNRPVHTVVQYPYTIDESRHKILLLLSDKDKVSFDELIKEEKDKIAIIFAFLAILELLQAEKINIQLGLGYNNFHIERRDASLEHQPSDSL